MSGKRGIIFGGVIIIIIAITYLVIQFAKGYRPDFSTRSFRPTGLLAATSLPDGAQVFVNDELKSATNTTITLAPDTYKVTIKKDGFQSWEKTLVIKKEMVVKTDAWLFSLAPDLRALTFNGAANPLISPDETKVAYQVSGNTEKNGLWVMDLSALPFGVNREPKMIVASAPKGRDFSLSTYQWSPDSKEILVTLKTATGEENFLLDPTIFTPATTLIDVTVNLPTIKKQWAKDKKQKEEQKIADLKPEIAEIITEKTKDFMFSPDEDRLLYTATASATIPKQDVPVLASVSTQPQQRDLKPGQTYVYDIKGDQNFLIRQEKDATSKLRWFPNSKHLFLVEKDKIQVVEYEGTNWTTIYAGPYEFPYAFPYASGDRLLMLIKLSSDPDSPPNLYSISLR